MFTQAFLNVALTISLATCVHAAQKTTFEAKLAKLMAENGLTKLVAENGHYSAKLKTELGQFSPAMQAKLDKTMAQFMAAQAQAKQDFLAQMITKIKRCELMAGQTKISPDVQATSQLCGGFHLFPTQALIAEMKATVKRGELRDAKLMAEKAQAITKNNILFWVAGQKLQVGALKYTYKQGDIRKLLRTIDTVFPYEIVFTSRPSRGLSMSSIIDYDETNPETVKKAYLEIMKSVCPNVSCPLKEGDVVSMTRRRIAALVSEPLTDAYNKFIELYTKSC